MKCPFCNADDTKVIDSRLVSEGREVRRRRECVLCSERFTTFESAELVMPKVIKRSGERQPFDEAKLRRGMQHALQKRPVDTDKVEDAVKRIMHKLRATCEREVSSQMIGEIVMEELATLDKVAYVRFASVYRSFQDVKEFGDEIKRLRYENIKS